MELASELWTLRRTLAGWQPPQIERLRGTLPIGGIRRLEERGDGATRRRSVGSRPFVGARRPCEEDDECEQEGKDEARHVRCGDRMYGIFRMMRRAAALLLTLLASCKNAGPMAKIEAVRDGLVADDAAKIKDATTGYPTCPDVPPAAVPAGQPGPRDKGCLSEIANGLGSKIGFRAPPVDQAAAATAALVLVRDGRGDWFVHADNWLTAIKTNKGSGQDALRLAVARKMAEASPRVGRAIEDEKTAADTLAAISSAIPGACATYQLIGAGTDPSKIPAELGADHAACVHKDLSRREGMGPSYGEGTFRALEGALALWRETERALRLGLSVAEPAAKSALEKKLAVIEPATQKIATKKVESAVAKQTVVALGDMHADAGVVLFRMKDAGADAAADAGQRGRDAK